MIIIMSMTIVIIMAIVILMINDNSLDQSHYHRPYHDPDLQPPPLPLQSHSKAVKVHSADLGFDVRLR